MGHVELVSTTINLVLKSSSFEADPDATPLGIGKDVRNTDHFIPIAQTSLEADSMGNAWRGDYQDIRQIWKGQHPVTGAPFRVEEGSPVGGPILELDVLPEEFAPGITAEDYQRIAKGLMENL